MPIKIYPEDDPRRELAWLCGDEWSLPRQIPELERWLHEVGCNVTPGAYIADVGFMWRRDAGGGGSALSPQAMKIMAAAGIWLHLSEYPGYSDEEPSGSG